MIQQEKWSKIDFYYCSKASTFLTDYGITKEPSLIIVDQSSKVVYKRSKYEH